MARRHVAPPAIVDEALVVLGQRIRLGRAERRWTAEDLGARAGVSGQTVVAAEQGRPGTAVGTAFTLAFLVGLPLFGIDDPRELARLRREGERELALLPGKVYHRDGSAPDAAF